MGTKLYVKFSFMSKPDSKRLLRVKWFNLDSITKTVIKVTALERRISWHFCLSIRMPHKHILHAFRLGVKLAQSVENWIFVVVFSFFLLFLEEISHYYDNNNNNGLKAFAQTHVHRTYMPIATFFAPFYFAKVPCFVCRVTEVNKMLWYFPKFAIFI